MRAEFLVELADLCKRHEASFFYTTDDDGIHIKVKGEEVFVGFIDDNFWEDIRTSVGSRENKYTEPMEGNAFCEFEAHLLDLIGAGLVAVGKPATNKNIYNSVQDIRTFTQCVVSAGADKYLIGRLKAIASYHPDYLRKIMAHALPSLS